MYAVRPARYHPTAQEPVWRPARFWPTAPAWVLDRGSLTQQLRRRSDNQFAVQVLSQGWQAPRPSEARFLGLRRKQWVLTREVLLLCQQQPWVFARSVIPIATLQGRLRYLRRFGSSSLGERLFNEPSMQRHPFELSQLPASSPLLAAGATAQQHLLWGRRCRFEIEAKSLMVSEFFLPAYQP